MDRTVKEAGKMFGAVIVTGARQVGKTTLLSKALPDLPHLTLDDPILLQSAIREAGTFFKDNAPPLCIDEVQYAPNLFPHMKMLIDREKTKGMFYMSGSQQFHMMKHVGESLAGRIGILNLLPLSLREMYGVDLRLPFAPRDDYLSARKDAGREIAYQEVWDIIHRGSMPQLRADPSDDWRMFYGAYVKSYIERDVRDLTQVGDEMKFLQFMTVLAARVGGPVNAASAARDVGISAPTAERWLSVLVASGVVYLLRPYHNNITKRTVKTPKVYFLDTGLAAYLTRWNTAETLKTGAMAGAFFENFVIVEIMKSYANKGVLDFPFYFYRDKDMREIDLLIEEDGVLYPIEIKKYADPRMEDVASFCVLDKIPNAERGPGGLVCMYDRLVTLQGRDRAVPVWML
jgi:predicted AAA+ superfamily ATPase